MFSRYFGLIGFGLWSILILDNYVDCAMTMQQMENAATGLRNVCIPKTGADPAMIAAVRNGQFPEDESLQCYFKCIMGMLKTMKNGRPLLDPILKQITMMMPAEVQERTIASARTCTALDFSENACVAAWQFVKCQYESDPEVFFFP